MKTIRQYFPLIALVVMLVIEKVTGVRNLSSLLVAVAVPTAIKTFPTIAYAKTTKKVTPFYPGKLQDALQAQQISEEMASDEDLATEAITLVRRQVETQKDNVLLGEYYTAYQKWDADTQEAHLVTLAGLQKVELPPAAKFSAIQRLLAILYAEFPEMTTEKDKSGTTRAQKQFSRAKADYDDYVTEQTQFQLVKKAEELAATGISEEKIKEYLESGNIETAAQLAHAIVMGKQFEDVKDIDTRDSATVKNLIVTAVANCVSQEELDFLRQMCEKARTTVKISANKLNTWFLEGREKAGTADEALPTAADIMEKLKEGMKHAS